MAGIHEGTGYYLGTTAACVASDTNQSLEDVCAAAGELKDLGLLVVVGATNGGTEPGEELWDINSPPSATYSPGGPFTFSSW